MIRPIIVITYIYTQPQDKGNGNIEYFLNYIFVFRRYVNTEPVGGGGKANRTNRYSCEQ